MEKDAILKLFTHYHPVTNSLTEVTASVMVLLIEKQNEYFLLVTKRPETIATYAGDYCFPGGISEKHDKNLRHTAEREMEEELNLNPADYTFISQLDDTQDRYGNLVRPFLSFMSHTQFERKHRIAHDEIESIYLLPLTSINAFQRDHALEKLVSRSPLYSYKNENVFIWGLTARIIVSLREILSKTLLA